MTSSSEDHIETIARALRLLVPEGDLIEIRAIGTEGGRRGIRSGYYTDYLPAARDAWAMSQTYRAAGTYYVLNQISPALLSQSPNTSHANGKTTSDCDILCRRWILIDIEGERPDKARQNATQEEVEAALAMADLIQTRIDADTQARPLRVMSGNGCHLLYRVDLPNDATALAAVKGFLRGLAAEFDTLDATVDCTVCNASRISKLPGTMTRKGKNQEDRPQRFAELLSDDVCGSLSLNYIQGWAPVKAAHVQASLEPFSAFPAKGVTKGRPDALERASAWLARREGAVEGSHGDEWTLATAGHLVRGFALPDDQALALLRTWNAKCSPPWEDRDLAAKIEHAHKYGDQPYGALLEVEMPTEKPVEHRRPWDYPQTDLGNAEYLRDNYGKLLRWCCATGSWFIWDSRRWAEDKSNLALGLANRVARDRKAATRDITDPDQKKYEFQHALKSEAASKRDSCLSQYKALLGSCVDIEALDSNPWLLNCGNGVLDLRTCKLSPHHPDTGLSRLAPCNYEPDAPCPQWEAYLAKVMANDQSLMDYLRRGVGYALTGSIRESALFVLWGDGSNGKSIFLETLGAILGDYSTMASTDAFLAKKSNGGPNPEVAMLRGVRFIRSSETPSHGRWDEATIKQLTGGDVVTARQLYGAFFQFRPVGKIWLATNHKPEVRGGDYGIWRRLQLIPFAVKIPKEEQDVHLSEKLREEWPGILAWAVRGCREWQEAGLQPPAAVLAATEEYRKESDTIDAFLDDCCTAMPASFWEESTAIYTAYVEWCHENGERSLTSAWLGRRLAAKGYVSTRIGGARVRRRAWCGLRLGKFDQAQEIQRQEAEDIIDGLI